MQYNRANCPVTPGYRGKTTHSTPTNGHLKALSLPVSPQTSQESRQDHVQSSGGRSNANPAGVKTSVTNLSDIVMILLHVHLRCKDTL